MPKSNQPDRSLDLEAASGFPDNNAMRTDNDLGIDAIDGIDGIDGIDADQADMIGKHRTTEHTSAGAAMATKAKTKTAQGQQSTQRAKQGNQPDIR